MHFFGQVLHFHTIQKDTFHTYDVDYIKINSPRLVGGVGVGGRAPADATPTTPARLLLNRSIPHSQIVKQDTVRGVQLTSEARVHYYAVAPAECAPACSADGNARLKKEKSHSFELVLALFPYLSN